MDRSDYGSSARSLVAICAAFGSGDLARLYARFNTETSLLHIPQVTPDRSKRFAVYSPRSQCGLDVTYYDHMPGVDCQKLAAADDIAFPFLERAGTDPKLLEQAVSEHLIALNAADSIVSVGDHGRFKVAYQLGNKEVTVQSSPEELVVSSMVKFRRPQYVGNPAYLSNSIEVRVISTSNNAVKHKEFMQLCC